MNTTIDKQTIQFLKDLKKHNDRDWFHANKSKYESAKENFYTFVNALLKELGKLEPAVAELTAKDCTFRINRDIRFSKDKSPYKTNFGALLTGKQNMRKAAYYLHLAPDEVFLAGGVYRPEPKTLRAVRQEIAYNAEDFLKIINTKSFKQYFVLDNEMLSKVPQGYDKNHPMAEYLKAKDMLALHNVEPAEIYSDKFLSYCMKIFKAMKPFNDFLNVAVSDVEE
jgi:uncharacterized protein (TIGR02453 family)